MTLLLLLAPTLDYYLSEALKLLYETPEVTIVGALVETRIPGSRLRLLRRELKKGRGGYVLVMAANSLQRAMVNGTQSSVDFMRDRGLPAWEVEDLYAPATIELIRGAGPDLMFRSGFGIIREPILSLAPGGVLSYHHGDIRRYRGQPVAFWELYKGERQMRVTLQILAEKLDAGTVVAERVVPIEPHDSWRALERRAYETGVAMLPQACLALARKTATPVAVPPAELGDLYTLPNFRQWATLQGKVLVRKARVSAPDEPADRPASGGA